jgi:hypothetical protein
VDAFAIEKNEDVNSRLYKKLEIEEVALVESIDTWVEIRTLLNQFEYLFPFV